MEPAAMDPKGPELRGRQGRPRRQLSKGMYILPSLFTTANIAAGYFAILQVTHGTLTQGWHFDNAAKAIGFAVLFDGLDGRIARMTGATSDFGRELDSLADAITFGVAPAMLAWTWGFRSLSVAVSSVVVDRFLQFGAIASFLFLMAGVSRLARFNITSNPQPSNPGRPGKKYFVGMPIPAGAGVIAAVVHFSAGDPIESWWTSLTWLLLIMAVAYLMVSTWRFYSFKDIDLRVRQPFRLIIVFAALFAGIWYFSRQVLFVVALLYMFSGVFWRLQWIFRRKGGPPPPAYKEASQIT
jgi:CDP-diacylglycerol--serine O-phosphatidyltransferase